MNDNSKHLMDLIKENSLYSLITKHKVSVDFINEHKSEILTSCKREDLDKFKIKDWRENFDVNMPNDYFRWGVSIFSEQQVGIAIAVYFYMIFFSVCHIQVSRPKPSEEVTEAIGTFIVLTPIVLVPLCLIIYVLTCFVTIRPKLTYHHRVAWVLFWSLVIAVIPKWQYRPFAVFACIVSLCLNIHMRNRILNYEIREDRYNKRESLYKLYVLYTEYLGDNCLTEYIHKYFCHNNYHNELFVYDKDLCCSCMKIYPAATYIKKLSLDCYSQYRSERTMPSWMLPEDLNTLYNGKTLAMWWLQETKTPPPDYLIHDPNTTSVEGDTVLMYFMQHCKDTSIPKWMLIKDTSRLFRGCTLAMWWCIYRKSNPPRCLRHDPDILDELGQSIDMMYTYCVEKINATPVWMQHQNPNRVSKTKLTSAGTWLKFNKNPIPMWMRHDPSIKLYASGQTLAMRYIEKYYIKDDVPSWMHHDPSIVDDNGNTCIDYWRMYQSGDYPEWMST